MKTNALEYLKHQHCQFRLSEHILSSAYPIIAQIMEEYVELSTNQANGAKQSTSNCIKPDVTNSEAKYCPCGGLIKPTNITGDMQCESCDRNF